MYIINRMQIPHLRCVICKSNSVQVQVHIADKKKLNVYRIKKEKMSTHRLASVESIQAEPCHFSTYWMDTKDFSIGFSDSTIGTGKPLFLGFMNYFVDKFG